MYLAQIRRVFEASTRFRIEGPDAEKIFHAKDLLSNGKDCFSMVLCETNGEVALLAADQFWSAWFTGVMNAVDVLT